MDSWQRNRAAIREHLDQNDISHFLDWSTIQATMYVGDAPYISHELAQIPIKDLHIAENPHIGTRNASPLCTNLIHQLYHLRQWINRRKLDISRLDDIVEFGAGYGAMALICHRFGFIGRYHIIDFPELARLQRYYLWQTLGNLDGFYWDLPPLCDLFIGCFSLCEASIEDREKLLSHVAVRDYLFASSYEFDGIDNQTWFTQLGGTVGYDWVQWPHPFMENAFYQVGLGL